MSRSQLYELVIPTDRWSIRAVSPIDITQGIEGESGRHPVLVHPGWGKNPERHEDLMIELADNGFLPIGADTRYGYCDRQTSDQVLDSYSRIARLLAQPYIASKTNPYFQVEGRQDNRWQYRRPTSLLYLCERLGIVERSYIGHSEGGRIVTLASLAQPERTTGIVIVNGAGSGDSSKGVKRMVRSNINNAKELLHGDTDVALALRSALGSTVYTMTHPRRTFKEKQVIQNTDLWALIDQLEPHGIPTYMLHAEDDELISFDDSAEQAKLRPWVDFRATKGIHSNVYSSSVRKLVVEALSARAA